MAQPARSSLWDSQVISGRSIASTEINPDFEDSMAATIAESGPVPASGTHEISLGSQIGFFGEATASGSSSFG